MPPDFVMFIGNGDKTAFLDTISFGLCVMYTCAMHMFFWGDSVDIQSSVFEKSSATKNHAHFGLSENHLHQQGQ